MKKIILIIMILIVGFCVNVYAETMIEQDLEKRFNEAMEKLKSIKSVSLDDMDIVIEEIGKIANEDIEEKYIMKTTPYLLDIMKNTGNGEKERYITKRIVVILSYIGDETAIPELERVRMKFINNVEDNNRESGEFIAGTANESIKLIKTKREIIKRLQGLTSEGKVKIFIDGFKGKEPLLPRFYVNYMISMGNVVIQPLIDLLEEAIRNKKATRDAEIKAIREKKMHPDYPPYTIPDLNISYIFYSIPKVFEGIGDKRCIPVLRELSEVQFSYKLKYEKIIKKLESSEK